MTLIDENEVILEQEKKKKMFKIITRAIIVLLLICIILLIYSNIVKSSTFKCYIDTIKNNEVKSDILLKDDNGKVYMDNDNVYISVRKLANALKYEFYNSEYKKKGEDRSKCQIKLNNIYTSYIAGSKQIYKSIEEDNPELNDKKKNPNANINTENGEEIPAKLIEFEHFTVSDSVKLIDDELYASVEAIELGFDVCVQYNKKDNTLKITTLNKLEQSAKVARKADVVDSSEYKYKNKRLLKYGMAIVRDSVGNLGVGSFSDTEKLGSFVASCKYKSIDFDEATKTLSVITSKDDKKSLLHINLEKQEVECDMNTQYEDIKAITNDFKYFLVKQGNKYGMVGNDGNTIIPIEYDEIGINEEYYLDTANKYILDNKYVPVKQNGLWGLYNVEGTEVIAPKYADIGCKIAQSGDSVVYINNISNNKTGIVFLYDKEKEFYGVYDADNGEKIAVSLTEVYKKVENDEDNYYVCHILDRTMSKAHIINIRKDI